MRSLPLILLLAGCGEPVETNRLTRPTLDPILDGAMYICLTDVLKPPVSEEQVVTGDGCEWHGVYEKYIIIEGTERTRVQTAFYPEETSELD